MKPITDVLSPEVNLEEELKKIWRAKYPDESQCLSPLAPKHVRSDACLFLSLNPSIENNPAKGFQLAYYCQMQSSSSFKENKAHKHYKKFFDLANELRTDDKPFDWFFLDLLFVRDTDQRNIDKIRAEAFIVDQAKLTLSIIEKIKPKIVIVANRLAGQILHENANKIGFNTALDQHNIYRLNGLDGIPFIIRESTFMGSRILWNSRKDKREALKNEINRVKAIIS